MEQTLGEDLLKLGDGFEGGGLVLAGGGEGGRSRLNEVLEGVASLGVSRINGEGEVEAEWFQN